jgi:hypothetical protein
MPENVYNPETDQSQSGAATKLANLTQAKIEALVQGVADGYKIARGVHTQVAASDTVVTGLATVVAVIVAFAGAPTVKQLFCAGLIGDQAGSPAAGSVLINTYKPTAVNDVTPTAATDFTDNVKIAWVAIGT